MSKHLPGAVLTLAAIALATAAQAQTREPRLSVEGTEFILDLPDGRTLRSRDLVGARLAIATAGGGALTVRIDAVEPDPDAVGAGVLLHTLSWRDAAGEWRNLCDAGPDGRRQAFPIAGRADKDASIHPAEAGAFELTCTGGAQGKCVRFGYKPWERGFDIYNSCVRLVRADYAGDGEGTTRNGQRIDIYDDLGVQAKADDARDEFEAGFAPTGAVCVRHARVPENVALASLEGVARLKGRVGGICTEDFARKNGALVFVRSPAK